MSNALGNWGASFRRSTSQTRPTPWMKTALRVPLPLAEHCQADWESCDDHCLAVVGNARRSLSPIFQVTEICWRIAAGLPNSPHSWSTDGVTCHCLGSTGERPVGWQSKHPWLLLTSGVAFCACQKSENIWRIYLRGLLAAEDVQADTASLGEDQFLFAVPWP